MHITSGFSPASGEMLDTTVLNLYGDAGDQCGGTTFFAVDHTVPESSHTVEIEYVIQTEETITDTQDAVPKYVKKSSEEKKKDRPSKVIKPPEKMAVDDTECDLTNLTWLQNITNIMSVTEFPIRPMSPVPPAKTQQPNTRLQKFNQTIAKCQKDFLENRNEYRTNGQKKPPYSYSTLICLAMKNNDNKMTLSAIYSWIRENFKFFRTADITWQNSIRHNLSLNKVFVKIARSKHEPGKGGFWKLDFAHLEGAKRISNRPTKKKKTKEPTETKATEEQSAVSNIPPMQITNIEMSDVASQSVTLHLPDFNLNSGACTFELDSNVGANVIVEPNIPPPLIPEDDLSTLLLNPTDWDDLQLDMLDNYLDTCFK